MTSAAPRFVSDQAGFTGAEKALLVCVGLALIGATGHLLSSGSDRAGGDARRTLAAGTGALSQSANMGSVVAPAGVQAPSGSIQSPGELAPARAIAFAAQPEGAPAPQPAAEPPRIEAPQGGLTIGDTAGHPRKITDAVYKSNLAKVKAAEVNITHAGMKGDLALFQKNWEKNRARYEGVAAQTGIPAELIAAIHWRESTGNFNTYLHQGDPLGRPARHVPRNIPVFHKWEDAAVHALNMKKSLKTDLGMTDKTTDLAAMATYAEYYNGLGYFKKGRTSPYVYAGTNQYQKGKYVADGVYDPNHIDRQLGIISMIKSIARPAVATTPPPVAPPPADERTPPRRPEAARAGRRRRRLGRG